MKAITYSTFGSAAETLHYKEVHDPIAGSGEVVVKLAYSGVNPSDVKARAGGRPGITKPPFNLIIPNSDGSGIITDVGDGVDKSRIDQRVWIWNGQWQRAYGTSAQYIALPEKQAVPLPDTTDLKYGAILGIPALTAVHAVAGDGSVEDKYLFISGGNGTVGRLAIQTAKALGARVITTASSKEFTSSLKESGADIVINYNSESLVEEVLDYTNGKLISRFIEVEFGANIDHVSKLIEENGKIVAFGSAKNMVPSIPFYPLMFRCINVELLLIYLLQENKRKNAIETLKKLLERKELRFQIDSIFSLNDAIKANELIESGRRIGSVLLEI